MKALISLFENYGYTIESIAENSCIAHNSHFTIAFSNNNNNSYSCMAFDGNVMSEVKEWFGHLKHPTEIGSECVRKYRNNELTWKHSQGLKDYDYSLGEVEIFLRRTAD